MNLIFAACSTNLPAVSTLPATSLPTATITALPSSSPTSQPTPTKTATRRPVATAVPPSPTPGFQVSSQKIEDADDGHLVETARWSDDGKTMYYAFHFVEGESKELQWVAYDVATQLTKTIQSPLNYDSRVWKRLAVPTPRLLNESVELRGNVSPSGKRVIYTMGYGGSGPYSTPEPGVQPRTEIWIADSRGKFKTKLKEFPDSGAGTIWHAAWFNNESEVLFGLYYEYGVDLYIANIENRSVVSLADVSEFKGGTETYWSLSPDGTTLAIMDFGNMLWLVSLTDGKAIAIEKSARMPYWSKRSNLLYYWWGPEFFHDAALHVYDTESKTISDVVDVSSLDNQGVPVTQFAVSPLGDKIALWGGNLWLVKLSK